MAMAVFWVVVPCSLAASASETSGNFYQTTLRYNPEGSRLLFINYSVSLSMTLLWKGNDLFTKRNYSMW
jgi:hypothetical protein